MINIVYKRLLLIIIGLFLGSISYAQHYADNWLFGEFGLKFQDDSVIVKLDYAPHQYRGMGIISDKNGNLLFYSDGFSVWNKNHVLMPNGKSLISATGSPLSQESLIVPKPGSETIYYLFTVNPYNGQASSGLYYSIIDLSLNNGLGDVVLKGKKVLNQVSIRITAVYHQNKQDVWVIVQKDNTSNYYSYLLSPSGLSELPVISAGSRILATSNGQLKASPDGRKVVSTYGGFDLFDFNNSTGQLFNLMSFTSPIPYVGFYGTEFSSDATKLFVHLHGSTGESGMYQYDLSGQSYEQINNSRILLFNEDYNTFTQMQLAPNGKIYITKGGGGGGMEHLGVIENPNEYGNDCKIVENSLYLEGKVTTGDHAPNFIQNYFFKTSFAVTNTCQGSLAEFHVTNESFLDSVRWYFGEGSSSNNLQPTFKYVKVGDYSVRLLAHYADKTDTIDKTITINPSPEFDLGKDTTVCDGHELSVAEGFTSYLWNTGETNHSIIIRKSGSYKLTVSNSYGCLLTDSVLINVAELPVVNMADSIYLGSLDSVAVNAGSFKSIQWSTGETTPSIYIKKEGWHSVTVENETGCRTTKSFYVYRNSTPNNEDPSGWKLLHPQPSAFTANDIFFLNSQTGFILNDRQLIGTVDGGNSWNVMMNITSGRRMAFKENIGYIIGDRGTIYKSTYMGGGWNKLNVGFTDHLNAISLISKDTVLITSDTKLFVSVDGGQSWKSSDVKGINILDSYFTSSKVGHVAGSNGTIFKTIDGGANWYITSSVNYTPADINRIYFVDSTTGFASRGHNDILKTTDGGETWKNIPNTSDKIYSYYFLDKQNGYIAGEHGVIFKTTNGGDSWDWIGFQNGRYAETNIYDIHFIDSTTGFAVGMYGRIMKTMDGGKSWKPYSITYNTIKQLKFITDHTAYGLVGNSFIKTTDDGKTWSNIGAPTPAGNTRQFDFINENIGYCIAGGDIGTYASMVYKTLDGGKTWIPTNKGSNILYDNLYAIDFTDQLTGYASGGYNGGATFKTIDGGNTWQQINSISFTQIQFVNLTIGFARDGYKRIYKTSDGGKSWNISFESNDQLQSLYFVNEKIGYCVGNNAGGYKTIDGGATWQKMELSYGYYTNVKFYNANVGFACEDYGKIYQTSDGGISWEWVNNPYYVNSIELYGKKIFAYGNGGVIIEKTFTYKPLSILVNVASGITNVGAILSGSVASNEGTIRNIRFQYGVYNLNNNIRVMPDSVLAGNYAKFNVELKDLKANTTYIYHLTATCNGVEYSSGVQEFTTLPDFEITMYGVYGLSSNEMNVSGVVVSNKDEISNIEFQYGTNNTYNFTKEALPNLVVEKTTQEIKAHLTALKPQTNYSVRIKAIYNDSVIYSQPVSFNTTPEYVIQFSNPRIIDNNATIYAYISAYKDTIRNIVLEYGTLGKYNRQVEFVSKLIRQYDSDYFPVQLNGLDNDSVYYYRIKASQGNEIIYSTENVLRIKPGILLAPLGVQKVSDDAILLNGLVNTNWTYLRDIQFEYGTTKEFGNAINTVPGAILSSQTTAIQAKLAGLLPNTEYHFRIKATDGNKTYYSEEFTYSFYPTSVNSIDKGSDKVIVYPNPAHKFVSIKSSSVIRKIELLDTNGSVLEASTEESSLDISNYPNGLYFIKVYTDKGSEIKKIVKN